MYDYSFLIDFGLNSDSQEVTKKREKETLIKLTIVKGCAFQVFKRVVFPFHLMLKCHRDFWLWSRYARGESSKLKYFDKSIFKCATIMSALFGKKTYVSRCPSFNFLLLYVLKQAEGLVLRVVVGVVFQHYQLN